MIHLTLVQLSVPMGAFHDVRAIKADEQFISILNNYNLEFLIPIHNPDFKIALTSNPYGPLTAFNSTEGVQYLYHLEIPDITAVSFSSSHLTITTQQQISFQWKVHPYDPRHHLHHPGGL